MIKKFLLVGVLAVVAVSCEKEEAILEEGVFIDNTELTLKNGGVNEGESSVESEATISSLIQGSLIETTQFSLEISESEFNVLLQDFYSQLSSEEQFSVTITPNLSSNSAVISAYGNVMNWDDIIFDHPEVKIYCNWSHGFSTGSNSAGSDCSQWYHHAVSNGCELIDVVNNSGGGGTLWMDC